MCSDADADCVDTAAGPENGRYKDHNTKTIKYHYTLNAGWAKRLQNILQLDDPSFYELLEIVTLAVAERNTDVPEEVTLSQRSSITLG